ncbi:MAG: hypothetical protein Satyrvirus47_4, partial [Satyrvirus sp.]
MDLLEIIRRELNSEDFLNSKLKLDFGTGRGA